MKIKPRFRKHERTIMKQLLKLAACALVTGVVLFGSCKKELSCENCNVNQPPIADAGRDTIIALPKDSVMLDGTASTDPDGTITSYKWAKIAGPVSGNILRPDSAKTVVKTLVAGVYQFELKVTDNSGLSEKDTVQIFVNNPKANHPTCGDTNRPHISVQLIPVGTLSQTRGGIAVASAANKILFAGGSIPSGSHSSRVDVYDLTTKMWSTAELSEARSSIAAIGAGDKVFFAGGDISDGTCATKTVDIYDISNNRWSASSLSIPGSKVVPAAVGNKVLFAGGDGGFCGTWARGTTVDIYDLTTKAWSTALLSSVKRSGHAAVTVNNKVCFSGGETWPDNPVPGSWYASNTVDIYDDASNSWSISSLNEGKLRHAGVAVNDKIFWAGGSTGYFPSIAGSCSVEIRTVSNGSVSIEQLSKPGGRKGVVKNNQIIFYDGYDEFDLYDVATDKWSIGVLPVGVLGASIISVDDTIYLVGGAVNGVLNDKVWKLEF